MRFFRGAYQPVKAAGRQRDEGKVEQYLGQDPELHGDAVEDRLGGGVIGCDVEHIRVGVPVFVRFVGDDVDGFGDERHAGIQRQGGQKARARLPLFEDQHGGEGDDEHQRVVDEAVRKEPDLRAHHIRGHQQGKHRRDDRIGRKEHEQGIPCPALKQRLGDGAVHGHAAQLPGEEPHRGAVEVDVAADEPLLPHLGEQHEDAEDEDEPRKALDGALAQHEIQCRKKQRDGDQYTDVQRPVLRGHGLELDVHGAFSCEQ